MVNTAPIPTQEIFTSRELYKQWDFGYNVIKDNVWCIHFLMTGFAFTMRLKTQIAVKRKRSGIMSSKELAKNLIDQIPESKMYYIIAYLQGAAIPEETPNAETLESIQELENGGGTLFTGSTENLFAELMEG